MPTGALCHGGRVKPAQDTFIRSRLHVAVLSMLAVFLAGLASAGTTWTDPETGIVYHVMEDATFNREQILTVTCYDARVAYDPEAWPAVVDRFGTEFILICQGKASRGTPFFLTLGMVYQVEGVQYDLGFDDTDELRGDLGRLREGGSAFVLVALTEARRGVPATLFYDDDGVEINLDP